ncbi:MAG TPA: hypothetical protein VJT49_05620 [Amycolatopsis sp.]|uniref:hypothetical protein n=1 Tax=Amycolatopsis sp. TaxID=37632 RepID=UPI002B45A4F8|nr:hypothetical protein [Amycolatopsis sp.]HKS44584.1 hypothetical protein [Amycolatopsis sp.]
MIVELVSAVESDVSPDRIREIVTASAGGRAGGRAKRRRLAQNPGILHAGRTPGRLGGLPVPQV